MVSTTNYWSEKGTRTLNYPWRSKKGNKMASAIREGDVAYSFPLSATGTPANNMGICEFMYLKRGRIVLSSECVTPHP